MHGIEERLDADVHGGSATQHRAYAARERQTTQRCLHERHIHRLALVEHHDVLQEIVVKRSQRVDQRLPSQQGTLVHRHTGLQRDRFHALARHASEAPQMQAQ